MLMTEYGIDKDHVIMHHHVTGKLCPAMWCHDESELEGWRKFQKMFGYLDDTSPSNSVLYYVQVGAFSSRANAEAYLETVKKNYPSAFIKTM